jgi:hypothetical protein
VNLDNARRAVQHVADRAEVLAQKRIPVELKAVEEKMNKACKCFGKYRD